MPVLSAEFDRQQSYFPVEGKPGDPFNGNFKMVVNLTGDVTVPANVWFIGFVWKGQVLVLATHPEPVTPPVTIYTVWKEDMIPTFADVLGYFGEEVPTETKTYEYKWATGFLIDEDGNLDPNGGYAGATDLWNTQMVVRIEGFPWDKVAMFAGIGVAALGGLVLMSMSKERYAAE